MNEWVRKSLQLARGHGYLDRLRQIYPAHLPPERPLSPTTKEAIISAFDSGNAERVLHALFRARDEGHPFPLEHPYASLMANHRTLITKNPDTSKELVETLFSLGVNQVIRGTERPADINRVMGAMFRKWLRTHFPERGYPLLAEPEFETASGVAFLDASDAQILGYATRRLGFPLSQGRDLLAKVDGHYVIGEARFLSTSGGSQSRDLRETIEFVRSAKAFCVAIGIMDGIVWFNGSYVRALSALGNDEHVLSALFLEEFLQSLR